MKLLTIEGLLSENQRAEHPDYEPELNLKRANAEEFEGGQRELI